MTGNTSAAILFVDICGSTRLFEVLGDVQAQGVVARALNVLSNCTETHGGTVVKTIGDELLCSFPDAAHAVCAAAAMQSAVAGDSALRKENLEVRVGVHFGPVVVDAGGDLYGDAVNVAARAVELAKAREVICTGELVAVLPAELKTCVRRLDRFQVHGKQKSVEFYEYLCLEDDGDGLTLTCAALPTSDGLGDSASALAPMTLVLEYNNKKIEVSERRPIVHIGRAEESDLIVHDQTTATGGVSLVSRRHASVEYRKGKFVLCDHSRNGTGVQMGDGRTVFAHREDVSLLGDGLICVGRRASKSPERLVRYQVVSG